MLNSAANRVLVCFVSVDEWSFAELCRQANYSTDLGKYYIQQLIRMGYLEKTMRGRFAITSKGRIQITAAKENQLFVTRSRLIALIVPTQGDKHVLVRRMIQPFIGAAEWPAGAVDFDESLPAAVHRITERRFGSPYAAMFVGCFGQREYYEGEAFDDKLFAVHSLIIPETHTIRPQSDTGTIELHLTKDLQRVPRPSHSLFDLYDYLQQAYKTPYHESRYDLSSSDLRQT